MNFINKLTYNPLAAPQEPQPEVTPQPADSQLQTNTGIASTPDTFVTVKPLDLYARIQQQAAPQLHDPMRTPPEQTVEASWLFNYLTDVQELQQPDPAESLETGVGETLEGFAEKTIKDTVEKNFGLQKEEAKSAMQRFANAFNESERTDARTKDATDDDWYKNG